MRQGEVATHAVRFRFGLESLPPDSRCESLKDFPTGSCGDAALLLGTYLLDKRCGEAIYVLGEKGPLDSFHDPWHSHAWLELDGYIVDITADQFRGYHDAVMVCKDSVLHSGYRKEYLGVADFRRYDERTAAQLGNIYSNVRAIIGDE